MRAVLDVFCSCYDMRNQFVVHHIVSLAIIIRIFSMLNTRAKTNHHSTRPTPLSMNKFTTVY